MFSLWTVQKPAIKLEKGAELDITFKKKTPLDSLLAMKLEELGVEEKPYMYRFIFPREAAVEIYSYLEREGHTAAKLFPGYSGVVQSMKERKSFRDIEESME